MHYLPSNTWVNGVYNLSFTLLYYRPSYIWPNIWVNGISLYHSLWYSILVISEYICQDTAILLSLRGDIRWIYENRGQLWTNSLWYFNVIDDVWEYRPINWLVPMIFKSDMISNTQRSLQPHISINSTQKIIWFNILIFNNNIRGPQHGWHPHIFTNIDNIREVQQGLLYSHIH